MTELRATHNSPRRNIFYLFMLFIAGLVLGALVSMAIIAGLYGKDMISNILTVTHTDSPGFINAFRIFISLGNTLAQFFAPAVFFAYVIEAKPQLFLKTQGSPKPILLLLVVLIVLSSLPVIDITAYFNQKMTFPPALKGLEQWIRDTEAQAAQTMNIVLKMNNGADLAIGLFIVALLPAISEEFFFRGCMQTLFKQWTQNRHAAVWITAAIFSFMHLEFLGFLPRLLMGAMLGYLFEWSGSIWPSVLAHFLNNGFSVLAMYLYQHKLITTNPDSNAPMFSQMWPYALSLALCVGLLLIYRKLSPAQDIDTDGEELDQVSRYA